MIESWMTNAALTAFPTAKYIQLWQGVTLVGAVSRESGDSHEAYQVHPWMPPAKYDPDAFVVKSGG